MNLLDVTRSSKPETFDATFQQARRKLWLKSEDFAFSFNAPLETPSHFIIGRPLSLEIMKFSQASGTMNDSETPTVRACLPSKEWLCNITYQRRFHLCRRHQHLRFEHGPERSNEYCQPFVSNPQVQFEKSQDSQIQFPALANPGLGHCFGSRAISPTARPRSQNREILRQFGSRIWFGFGNSPRCLEVVAKEIPPGSSQWRSGTSGHSRGPDERPKPRLSPTRKTPERPLITSKEVLCRPISIK